MNIQEINKSTFQFNTRLTIKVEDNKLIKTFSKNI